MASNKKTAKRTTTIEEEIDVDTIRPKPKSAYSDRLKSIAFIAFGLLAFAGMYHMSQLSRRKQASKEQQVAATTASEAATSSRPKDTEGAMRQPGGIGGGTGDTSSSGNVPNTHSEIAHQSSPPGANQYPSYPPLAQMGQTGQTGQTQLSPEEQIEQKRLDEEEAARSAPINKPPDQPAPKQQSQGIPPILQQQLPTQPLPGQSGSPTNVPNTNGAPTYPDPAYIADLTRKSFGMLPTTVGQMYGDYGTNSSSGQNNQNDQAGKETFAKPSDSSTLLRTERIDPPSRYMLMQGSRIPVELDPTIKSDFKGEVTAIVRKNVFDDLTGKHLLIPVGTKLVGQYNSHITYGQKSVQVAWTRLIYPDTTSRDLGKMLSYSSDGTSGLTDKVDNHWKRIIGGALLSSMLAAGVQISQNRTNTGVYGYPTAGQELGAALGQGAAQVGQQITSQNVRLQPTIIIRPGKIFYIFVNKDIDFLGEYSPRDIK